MRSPGREIGQDASLNPAYSRSRVPEKAAADLKGEVNEAGRAQKPTIPRGAGTPIN
jgi:hypothetical protein